MIKVQPENILRGSFWPEKVRVILVKSIGESQVKIEAVGLETQRFYNPILSEEDLTTLEIIEEKPFQFSGDGESLFLYLESHRIRNAFQFDPLYAVNISQIDPLPHQIEAVYHHIMPNPRIRFLLADDPGAGKTIMAGLLLKELKYRGVVERTLIVVPGHLKDQWLREMKEKFQENFTVIDRDVMNASWGQNLFTDRNQIIVSMDFAKQDDVMFAMKDSKWDLCIVDEAHKMSAYKYGEKISKTQRYTFGELLSPLTNSLLFLTATPHRGDPENFRLLLDLLEPGFFADTAMLSESIQNKDNPLFLRRLKEDLKDFEKAPIFPPRKVETVKYYLSDDEKRLYNAVTEYVKVKEASLEALATRHIDLTRILGEQRIARENRLVPEYIEEFFKRSAKALNIKIEKRQDGFWHVTSVPFEIRNQPYEFKAKFGEVQREYSKVSFDKEKAFKGQAEFVAMGHPLLEAVVSTIFTRYESVAGEGATFIDPEGKRDGILWFFEAEIKDGKNDIAGKRLFAVYQTLGKSEQSSSFVSPTILWDLKPTADIELHGADGENSEIDRDAIKSFVVSHGLEHYKKELLERRQRDARIKKKYGIRSLESMILDSDAKISEYETRRMKGENIPEATIQNEMRKKEDLERKKQRLLKDIEAEVHLYPTEPKVIGAVRVIPGKMQGEMVSNEEIEQIGMKVALDYEKRQGREPEDVHLENLGYDIRSRDKKEQYRYIEVKARAGEGAIALTPNEWLMAQRLKEEYWLYVVANAVTHPELYIIQNPALHFNPAEEISIVRYVVKDWKDKAEMAE